jgi:hypothetical protein
MEFVAQIEADVLTRMREEYDRLTEEVTRVANGTTVICWLRSFLI